MARSIGIARSALDNYVTGKRAIPVPTVYAVCETLGIQPHVLVSRAEERLLADDDSRDARVTPLRRGMNVPDPRDTEAEVAFRSHLRHDADTDDLYE